MTDEATLAVVEPATIELAGAARADRDPRLVYLASLGSEKGRRTMRGALDAVARILGSTAERLPWAMLEYQHLQALRSRLAERYAPATCNKLLAATRGVLREARRLGLMSAEACARASDVKPVRGQRLPKGRSLGPGEVHLLLRAAAGDRLAGARDAALLAVLYGSGLRRAEAVALELADWRADDGSLRVRGKGNKERVAYVAAGRPFLDAWLAARGTEPGPLFLPIDRWGKRASRPLTDGAVRVILRRLAARAGVADFSPHDCRRTFISDLLDAGADLSVVQQLAGHAQVTTTQRYDRRGEDAKKRAARLIRM